MEVAYCLRRIGLLMLREGAGRHVAFPNSSCTVYEIYTCFKCRQVYIQGCSHIAQQEKGKSDCL